MGGEHLSEIDFEEQDLLDREALTEPYHRLSCQAMILGDVVVQVPEEKWASTAADEQDSSNATKS